ncbi:MAG: cobyrinate a,c-diamide synthase [Rhizobiaceae bacterium]
MTVQRGLMIAAPHSGSGKTVLTLALLRALRDHNIDVRAAKVGPDYIDPAFHEIASGHGSVNLDPWAMPDRRLKELAASQGGSHLLVEAMMGLYDGAADGTGSAADLAESLGLPVLLVVDAQRQSHSVAALVRGFRDHRPGLMLAGVILNKVGSARHEAMLVEALSTIEADVFGAIPRDPSLALPERHLGLVQAGEVSGLEAFIERCAEFVGERIDFDHLLTAFRDMDAPSAQASSRACMKPPGQRVSIARDAAFSFIYPHLVGDWHGAGASISFFSPLANETPDKDCDAVYLPGGYPELHAGKIAANSTFLAGLREFAARSVNIFGECGGYMVLGQGLEDAQGARHGMAGLLELETSFARRRLHLGYRKLAALNGALAGQKFAAHEFHYSTVLREEGVPLFQAEDALGEALGTAGLVSGSVSGSYMHLIGPAGGTLRG